MRIKVLISCVFFGFLGLILHAQSPMKVGFVNVDYVLSNMPETKQAQQALQDTNTQMKNQLQTAVKNYQDKLKNYQSNVAGMSDEQRKTTEAELTQEQQRIQQLERDMQISLQKKQREFFQPIYNKLSTTINEVAKEEGFTHVLNSKSGNVDIVLYAQNSYNISNSVLRKMGVTVEGN